MDMKEYIISDGERSIGRLSIRPDGLYTVLEARAEDSGELTRLYISGGGKCRCLGVMLPEDGALTLRRRLSRLELLALPQPVEGVYTRPPEEKPPHIIAPEEKSPPPPTPEAAQWRPAGDGSLIRLEPEGRYIALPAKLRRAVPGIRLTTINGREYLVFRY